MTAAGQALEEHATAAALAFAAAEREAAEKAVREEQQATARRAFSVQVSANAKRLMDDSPLGEWFPGVCWQIQDYDRFTSSVLNLPIPPPNPAEFPRAVVVTDMMEPNRVLLELSRNDDDTISVRTVQQCRDDATLELYYSGAVCRSVVDVGRCLAALETRSARR